MVYSLIDISIIIIVIILMQQDEVLEEVDRLEEEGKVEVTKEEKTEEVCKEHYSVILLPTHNPRRACAARVTVRKCVCLSVRLSVTTFSATMRNEITK
jgi:hypothetical protein